MSGIKDILRLFHIKYLRFRSSCKPHVKTNDRILIIAPHPDDEVIGCGGIIARKAKIGQTPHIIFMTGGEESHHWCCSVENSDITRVRRGLTRLALKQLGVNKEFIHELNFPDGSISPDNSEIHKLIKLIEKIKPSTIFIPHWGEGWPDHVNTARIVKDILPSDTEIWEYCVWMWYYNVWRGLDWKNAATLSMTPEEHSLKLKAMDAYTTPLAPCGKPWSGVLPHIFIKANQWDKELFFKVR